MKNSGTTFSTTDFLNKLNDGTLAADRTLSLHGLVRKSNAEAGVFEFLPAVNDSTWMNIPAGLVEEVRVLRTVSRRGELQHLVSLVFRAPTTEEGKVLASLLRSYSTSPRGRIARIAKDGCRCGPKAGVFRRPNPPEQEDCIWICHETEDAWYCYAVCFDPDADRD